MSVSSLEYEPFPEVVTDDDVRQIGSRSCTSLCSATPLSRRLLVRVLLLCSSVAFCSALLLLCLKWSSPDYLSLEAQAEYLKTVAKLDATSHASNKSTCLLDTGGTCSLFPCSGARGATFCVHRKCMCRPGYCAKSGKCVHYDGGNCDSDTGGTCTILPCDKSRGHVECKQRHCLCKKGYCANSGKCVKRHTCDDNTGGSCHYFPCDASRGHTECRWGKCLCKTGYCSDDGECVRPGACSTVTGGTCRVFDCDEDRGLTRCDGGQCVCESGYCARDGVCVLKQSTFTARVFGVNQTHPTYPKARGEAGEVSTALCISGGGSRSLAFTMGVLRALEELGLMSKIEGMSTVSGGAWAGALYMFGTQYSMRELLGKPHPPSNLTLLVLEHDPPIMGAAVTSSMFPFLRSVASKKYMGSRLWIDYVSAEILKPLAKKHPKYMAYSEEHIARIRSRNPDLPKSSFIVPRQDRARVFVINGAVLAPQGYTTTQNNVVSLQISPDWTGSPFFPDNRTQNIEYNLNHAQAGLNDLRRKTEGGGFVETFAFGSAAPDKQFGEAEAKKMGAPAQPFSLGAAVGISSCAIASVFASLGAASVFTPVGAVWPVSHHKQEEMNFQLGDGGEIDNAGLLPMLQRGAKKVLWLINTDTGIEDSFNWCGEGPWKDDFNPNKPKVVTNQLTDKFGYPDMNADFHLDYLANNKVFRKTKLPEVVCKLQNLKKSGKLPLLRTTLRVLPNSWWGIRGNYDLDIAFLYLERSTHFEDHAIKDWDVRREIRRGAEQTAGKFKRWPFFRTVFQNAPEGVKYTNEQVNLLAAYGEYAINENKDILADMFG